jgi:hypothetical protein
VSAIHEWEKNVCRSGKLKLEAVEADDGFKGFTESEEDSGARQGVLATWIDEL